MNKKFLSLILVLFGLLTELANTQNVITENKTGQIDGYSYELWKDYGTTSMTLLGGGKFSCSWSNIGNALFRIGKNGIVPKLGNNLVQLALLIM